MTQIGYLNRQMPNIIIGKLDKGEGKMKHIITDNAVEKISVITSETQFCLKHKIKGPAQHINVTILNKREAERLQTILNNWLKNKVDGT